MGLLHLFLIKYLNHRQTRLMKEASFQWQHTSFGVVCHWGYESVNVFVPLSGLRPPCHLISLVASNTARNSAFPSPFLLPIAFPEAGYFYLVPIKFLFLWITQYIWALGLFYESQGSCSMLPSLTDFAFWRCHLDTVMGETLKNKSPLKIVNVKHFCFVLWCKKLTVTMWI